MKEYILDGFTYLMTPADAARRGAKEHKPANKAAPKAANKAPVDPAEDILGDAAPASTNARSKAAPKKG